jgi:hypothetical protein
MARLVPLTKREASLQLLQGLFAKRDRIPVPDIIAAGERHGIGRRTLRRAANELGIETIQAGPNPGYWTRGKS